MDKYYFGNYKGNGSGCICQEMDAGTGREYNRTGSQNRVQVKINKQ
jgi:hypothetical protein